MSKKFLSDVLIECGLQVSGTTTLGTATATTVATSDNSTNIATTAFVKAQGYITGYTNNYVTAASFNTANGVLTLSRQGLTDVTVDLDNRYLTAEADTLDTVTSRSGVTTNTIGVGTINVTGSTAGAELLTVDGSYGRLFTVTDDLTDSLFSVNTVAGLPALEVFADNSIKLGAFANPIEIDSSSNIVIPGTITASGYNDSNWNAAYNDRIVSAAVTGTTTKTITLNQQDGGTITATWTDINTDTDGYIDDVRLNGNSLDFSGQGSAFSGSVDLSSLTSVGGINDLSDVDTVTSTPSNGEALVWDGTNWVPGTISTTNNYLTGLSFNTGNGVLTATRQGLADLTVDLDGRYLTSYSETDTLATVTSRGNTTTNAITTGTHTIYGTNTTGAESVLLQFTASGDTLGSIRTYNAGAYNQHTRFYTSNVIGTTETLAFMYDHNGNVGIGTASPSGKLHIADDGPNALKIGDTQVSTIGETNDGAYPGMKIVPYNSNIHIGISSTNDNKINLWHGGGNYTYWKQTSTYSIISNYSTSDLALQIHGGNVGIGTTSPSYKLDVNGSVFGTSFTVTGGFSIQQAAGTATYGMTTNWLQMNGHGIYTTTSTYLDLDSASSTYSVRGFNNDPFAVFKNTGTANTDRLVYFLPDGGNLGVGTSSPSEKLEVAGNLKIQANATNAISFKNDGSFTSMYSDAVLRIYQRVEVWGGGAGKQYLDVRDASGNVKVMLNGADNSYFASNNLGVGTTSPNEKLHVVGNVKIDNGSTSATLETTDKVADPAGAVYATYPTNSTYGAFVDYVVYDSGRDSMRVGTMRATWNANEVVYADVSTVDIGDTSVVTMTAVLNGTDVDLVVTGDSVFTVKLNVKVIR